MARKTPQAQTINCPKCGQPGNQPPGLKLQEYEGLQAVFVLNDSDTDFYTAPTPQRLVCQNCGHAWPVARGSIEVRKV